ncbi:MAG: zinc ribbon domain-containing protein [Chloroflexi bacterium]|nr:zinc ribbon domain-containing protein [Chloroflexota bacterium]
MSTGEYKCQQCSMEFTVPGACTAQTESAAACPLCGSAEVRELTEAERLAKLVLGFRRGG